MTLQNQDLLQKLQKDLIWRSGGFIFSLELLEKVILRTSHLLVEFEEESITDTSPEEDLMNELSEELIGEEWPIGMTDKDRSARFFEKLKQVVPWTDEEQIL